MLLHMGSRMAKGLEEASDDLKVAIRYERE
jgi:hypothetical protein